MKNSASRTGAASSVDTTTKVVRLSARVRVTASARSTKPVAHRLEEEEELGDVLEELRAEDAIGHRVEGLRGEASAPGCGPAR